MPTFLVPARTTHGKFKLILTVKMEARHHVEGSRGSEFPAICNHCGVMAAWSQDLEFLWEIFAFLENWPLMATFSNLCSENFHCLTNRRCVEISWNLANGKSAQSCVSVIYLTKKQQNFGCLSKCRYCADRAQNLPAPNPRQCTQRASDFIQIVSLSAEL